MEPAFGKTVADVANQHDPDAHTRSLARRSNDELPFDPAKMPPNVPVMFDTNFYLHRIRGKLPPDIADFVANRHILHSGVACNELAISAGILDPAIPGTARNRSIVMNLLQPISAYDVVAPSAAAWAEAGMLAGILARTQHLAKPKKDPTPDQACCQQGLRRKLINDALIFLSAYEQNAILVSANAKGMDLLLQFRQGAHVLLFRPQPAPPAESPQ